MTATRSPVDRSWGGQIDMYGFHIVPTTKIYKCYESVWNPVSSGRCGYIRFRLRAACNLSENVRRCCVPSYPCTRTEEKLPRRKRARGQTEKIRLRSRCAAVRLHYYSYIMIGTESNLRRVYIYVCINRYSEKNIK